MTSLYVAGDSPLHRFPAQVKIVAGVLFVLTVVATPSHLLPAFVGYAVLVVALVVLGRLTPWLMLRRMTIEVPFVLFALTLPFLGQGQRIDVGPLTLSEPGVWAAWNILVKATIGTAVAVVLAATTPAADLVGGLARLRLPAVLVLIAGFMIRYSEVVVAEIHRTRTAMAARGFRARHVRSWPQLAQALAALFIRTYERGERIHVAMTARGFDGTARGWDIGMVASPALWLAALALPVTALAVRVVAGVG